MLLEKWVLTYAAPSESSKVSSFDCPESVQLLRCLICACRLFPAFYLSKDYGTKPNHYEMSYAVSHKAIRSPDFNTPDITKYDFPSVSTAQGSLSARVEYRNSCAEFSVSRFLYFLAFSNCFDAEISYYRHHIRYR